MGKQDIGLIGLAVMGQNLVLNMESKGFSVAVFNRTGEKTEKFAREMAAGKNILPTYSLDEFVNALSAPRKIMLMVKAGQAVDDFIAKLKPLLSKGDIVIDGGNSFFMDTERRSKELEACGLRYIGTGVSGGEEGALKGPSIMPGGQEDAYRELEPILTKTAAQVDGSCCTYIGLRGAGHYVKMVHNGIEYGDMQLICEAYYIMKNMLGLTAEQLHEIFAEWNRGELNSYLIEITADIFSCTDEETGQPLVELILDKAGQKGTGKWTSQNALDLGVPVPTINAAVTARIMSAYKDERIEAAKILNGPAVEFDGDTDQMIEDIRNALYASKITSYAQGMALLKAASEEYGYNLNFGEIARIWKGGCIIRAQFLDRIKQAFQRREDLPNLLMDPEFREDVNSRQQPWRKVVCEAKKFGIPVPAMSASLDYFDSYRQERLSANLIQAQRDYFGAHTYKRIDKDGVFHTEWIKLKK